MVKSGSSFIWLSFAEAILQLSTCCSFGMGLVDYLIELNARLMFMFTGMKWTWRCKTIRITFIGGNGEWKV